MACSAWGHFFMRLVDKLENAEMGCGAMGDILDFGELTLGNVGNWWA